MIEIEKILSTLKRKGYKVFENSTKPFNINIVGIRSSDKTPNVFNDLLMIFWKFNNEWIVKEYRATTDPGNYWIEHPMNPKGCAVMKTGQYPGAYKIGDHLGHKALVQVAPVTVLRNGVEDTGMFGVDIHSVWNAVEYSNVDKWSAGCQVISNSMLFNNDFLPCCEAAAKLFGNSFTYTLIEESDLIPA